MGSNLKISVKKDGPITLLKLIFPVTFDLTLSKIKFLLYLDVVNFNMDQLP